MINVTKSYLPPFEEYATLLRKVWASGHLTNHGPLVNELEQKVREYLGVKHFFFLNNGTIALQIALRALDVTGEVITTPFSYVATTSSIIWENATPVFVDVNESDYTIDTSKIEAAITGRTTAILATHVYGIPCGVEEIEAIARKRNLKVIYDAAHAFGVTYKGKSVFNYGDISTVSFHATKLFHTVEGGGIATNDDEVAHRVAYMRNFGHKGQEDFWGVGINGKNSEFHAAMGVALFPYLPDILRRRQQLSELYRKCFADEQVNVTFPVMPAGTEYNYGYFPVVFGSEEDLLSVRDSLNASFIYPRRYFYPSLNCLPFLQTKYAAPVSEQVAKSVLCLPLFPDLPEDIVRRTVSIIAEVLKFKS